MTFDDASSVASPRDVGDGFIEAYDLAGGSTGDASDWSYDWD